MTIKKAPIPRKTAAQHRISLETVAKKDDTLDTLKELRDGIARQLDDCTSKRDYAALSRQLQQVLAEIESHRKSPRSIRNELAEKRRARQAAAAVGALHLPAQADAPAVPESESGDD